MTSGRLTPHIGIHKLIIEFVCTKTGDPAEDKQKQVGDEAMPPGACWPESPGEAVNELSNVRSNRPVTAKERDRTMNDQNFTSTFSVDQTPTEAFDAINNVRGWWSGEIEGSADKFGDQFTYRHGDLHYSKQKVTEFIPGKKVVWLVLDCGPNFVRDRTEWKGTEMTFEISKNADKTDFCFAHVGLVPELECFGK